MSDELERIRRYRADEPVASAAEASLLVLQSVRHFILQALFSTIACSFLPDEGRRWAPTPRFVPQPHWD